SGEVFRCGPFIYWVVSTIITIAIEKLTLSAEATDTGQGTGAASAATAGQVQRVRSEEGPCAQATETL
ncbi:MAG: hypothetical protein ACYC5G_03235, partial [Candidatus Doudnabacteria bacterium]